MTFSEHLQKWALRCGRGSTPAQREQIAQWCREFSDIPEFVADAAFKHLDAHILGSEDRRGSDWPRYADIRKAVGVGRARMAEMMGGNSSTACEECNGRGTLTGPLRGTQLRDAQRIYGHERGSSLHAAYACACPNGARYQEIMGTWRGS